MPLAELCTDSTRSQYASTLQLVMVQHENDRAIPGVAILCNSVPPYREHVHRRIARELPTLKLYTLCTHTSSDTRWTHRPSAEIGPVSFGPHKLPQDVPGLNCISYRKGGEIVRWLSDHDIKAVICLGYNDLALLRVIAFCNWRGIPCFIWGDSNIRLDNQRGVKAWAKKLIVGTILALASGALACGRYGKAYFQKYGVNEDRIFLFPNEPDYDLIASMSDLTIEAVRQRFELSPQRRRLVYSGRLVDVKRVDLLIAAFLQIAAIRPNWDLLIVGDGVLRMKLEASIPPEHSNRVQWTGFLDDQETVGALYRLSDALVLPSSYEPWALVVNEAAAAGLAIVASDVVGAAPELISDRENGRIFPSDDLDALTAALVEVTHPDNIDRMKAASSAVLARWRRRADPVQGLVQALQCSQVLRPWS